jgi:spore coat protein CotH
MLLNRSRTFLAALTVAVVTLLSGPAAQVPAAPDPSDAFFDDTVVHDIRLAINGRDLTSLHVNFLANDYYPVNYVWRDKALQGVGIRSRGTGSRNDLKPGLRIDFDRWALDQKFLGLKSVILRNNTQDATGLRERLSMLFFRRMGLAAPREAHARLFFNNDYGGLYTIVESVDKVFLKKNYGEDTSNLYEFHFDNSVGHIPFIFKYLGSDANLYVPTPFKPETKEHDTQPQYIERLIWTIDQAGDAAWRQSMAEYLDLSKFIRHLAIENFLAEEDGITGDYGPNNFYFYRYENKNLFQFIPWDKSNTFWEAPSPNYSIFRNIEDGPLDHRNRLVMRALGYTDLWTLYLDTLIECANSASTLVVSAPPVTPALTWLENEVVRDYTQIREASLADPVKPFTNAQFEAAVEDLKTFARLRADAVRAQVAAARLRTP